MKIYSRFLSNKTAVLTFTAMTSRTVMLYLLKTTYTDKHFCVSSQPLITQKYHEYHRNQNKKGKRFCKNNIYEVNIKKIPISSNSVDELKLT